MNNRLSLLAFFLSLLMFICLINYYNINYPIADDYDSYLNFLNNFTLAPNFKAQLLTIMNQHVDHRIVMARLVCLIYYKIFGNINFRHLLYISQLILIISIYPYTWLLNRVNPNYKVNNFILATSLILCPSLCSAYIWLSVTLQQDMQILFSLLSIIFLIKLEEHKSIINYSLYILFMILNVFSESGWIILFGAILLYCLLSKQKLLFLLNLIFFIIMSIIFFKLLPYEFRYHEFGSIFKLMLFILGFTGETFFTGIPYIAFIIGFLLIIATLFNRDIIKNNNVYLVWFIFFFANAFIIGIARIAGGSLGTDDRYTIYSLLNLGFIITLLSRKYRLITSNKFWIILIALLLAGFIRELPDGGPYKSYQEGRFTINYPPDISRAINIYNTAKQFGIYSNQDLDNHIKHFYPTNNIPAIFNNLSGSGGLYTLKLNNEYTQLNGFIYLRGFDISKFDKYVVWQSSSDRYWFILDANNNSIEQLLYNITNNYYFYFTSVSYIKGAKPGSYAILLYLTNGKNGGFITLKTNVVIK